MEQIKKRGRPLGAKNKPKTITIEENNESEPQTSSELLEEQSIDKILQVLKSHEISGGKVRIFRKGPLDTGEKYVNETKVEDFSVESIKRLYGGGDYRVEFLTATGRIFSSQPFGVDYRIRGALDEQIKETDQTPLLSAINKLSGGLPVRSDDLIWVRMMELQNQKSDQIFQLMLKSQENTMLTLAKAMENRSQLNFENAITPILVKMIDQKTSPMDSLEAIKMAKEIFSDVGEEEDSLDKIAKILGPVAAMFLGNRLAPGLPAPPAPNQITSQISDPPKAKLEQQHWPSPMHSVSQSSNIGTVGGSSENSGEFQQSQQPMNINFTIQIVRQLLPMLLTGARNNTDVLSYYDIICDHIPEEQLDELIEILKKPGWRQELFNDHPDVITFAIWFEKLRQVFLENDADNSEKSPAPTNV